MFFKIKRKSGNSCVKIIEVYIPLSWAQCNHFEGFAKKKGEKVRKFLLSGGNRLGYKAGEYRADDVERVEVPSESQTRGGKELSIIKTPGALEWLKMTKATCGGTSRKLHPPPLPLKGTRKGCRTDILYKLLLQTDLLDSSSWLSPFRDVGLHPE